MKIIDGVQFWILPRFAQGHGARQSRQHLGEAKTAAETVGRIGQIAPRILRLSKGMVAVANGAPHIARHYVHPTRALTSVAARPQPATSSLWGMNRLDDSGGWVLQRLISYNHDEKLLVFRPTARFADVALTSEIGIVELHEIVELPQCFALSYDPPDLVFELPGRVVAPPRATLKLQPRHVGLVECRQVHGQKPCRERQSASFEYGSTTKSRLEATQVVPPSRSTKPRPRSLTARGAAKLMRQARPVALRVGAVLLDELHHRQLRLKLHQDHHHDRSQPWNMASKLHLSHFASRDGQLNQVASQRTPQSTDLGAFQ